MLRSHSPSIHWPCVSGQPWTLPGALLSRENAGSDVLEAASSSRQGTTCALVSGLWNRGWAGWGAPPELGEGSVLRNDGLPRGLPSLSPWGQKVSMGEHCAVSCPPAPQDISSCLSAPSPKPPSSAVQSVGLALLPITGMALPRRLCCPQTLPACLVTWATCAHPGPCRNCTYKCRSSAPEVPRHCGCDTSRPRSNPILGGGTLFVCHQKRPTVGRARAREIWKIRVRARRGLWWAQGAARARARVTVPPPGQDRRSHSPGWLSCPASVSPRPAVSTRTWTTRQWPPHVPGGHASGSHTSPTSLVAQLGDEIPPGLEPMGLSLCHKPLRI